VHKSRLILVIVIVAAVAALGGWLYARSRRDVVPTTEAVFAEIIARVDKDHDGRISPAEWQAYGGSKEVFEAYDFNADGSLDVSEFQAMFYSMDPKPNI
jgi:hypothetical protein